MKSFFTIGKIVRPRGLRGELKFEIYSDNPSRFLSLDEIMLDGAPYEVDKLSAEGGFGYLKLKGVDDVDAAEKLRGKKITVRRDALPPLPDGRYYIADIIGCDAVLNGDVLGEITDVLQYGSADVYVIKLEKGSVSVPVIDKLIENADVDNGRIVFNDVVFDRVAVFND